MAARTYRPLPIEDYAMIGDGRTGALVGRNGSIDWLCWPVFDSDACFAALLGEGGNGRWALGPTDGSLAVQRRYRGETMILETVFETTEGSAAVIDFMPLDAAHPTLVRQVEGRSGRVPFSMLLALRFEYGSVRPWVESHRGDGLQAVAGENRVVLRGSGQVDLKHRNGDIRASFEVAAGDTVSFVAAWGPSHLEAPPPVDVAAAYERTERAWTDWAGRCTYQGRSRDAVMRSLLTLKALSFTPTGALVAALTTSLPEQLGGPRNWDYRYCWLRDSTLTLVALMAGGYLDEAQAWVGWLHRAVAGDPADLQIMYGLGGQRRLIEWEVSWLSGYEGSSPVRVGNAASGQLQLDTYGEVMGALSLARRLGLKLPAGAWTMQRGLLDHLEGIWREPDDGIWEVRGGRRHFTHSKVMAWYAFDRAIDDAARFKLEGPIERWRLIRDEMHRVVCERGFNRDRNSFTQSFESTAIDASLLLIPRVGFLPMDDPRVLGTVSAIEADLLEGGLVLRYRTESGADGLPGGEGAFLPCSYWLATAYIQLGRRKDADALLNRLVGMTNDVGLQSEEYDVHEGRMLGNFPQAYSHLSLVAASIVFDAYKTHGPPGGSSTIEDGAFHNLVSQAFAHQDGRTV